MRFTVHKNIVKISVFGADDIWLSNENSAYRVDGTLIDSK